MKHVTNHYYDTFGCFPMFAVLAVLVIGYGLAQFSNWQTISIEERQKTERMQTFFNTMIEVEEIRSDRDKTIAEYEMLGKIKSSWANAWNVTINKILALLGLIIFGVIWILVMDKLKGKYD